MLKYTRAIYFAFSAILKTKQNSFFKSFMMTLSLHNSTYAFIYITWHFFLQILHIDGGTWSAIKEFRLDSTMLTGMPYKQEYRAKVSRIQRCLAGSIGTGDSSVCVFSPSPSARAHIRLRLPEILRLEALCSPRTQIPSYSAFASPIGLLSRTNTHLFPSALCPLQPQSRQICRNYRKKKVCLSHCCRKTRK